MVSRSWERCQADYLPVSRCHDSIEGDTVTQAVTLLTRDMCHECQCDNGHADKQEKYTQESTADSQAMKAVINE